jgi:hypothetical protein
MGNNAKRFAALRAIDAFCAREGFPLPPLEERAETKDGVPILMFVGKGPDGREFGIGYEASTSIAALQRRGA